MSTCAYKIEQANYIQLPNIIKVKYYFEFRSSKKNNQQTGVEFRKKNQDGLIRIKKITQKNLLNFL